jgi:ATP-dependent DNA ligase
MFEFCIPTRSTIVPSSPDWLHEIKYDGYRLRLERDGDRLITRGGYNWADHYPWIVEAALKNRHRQFVIDGEAVVLGIDGVSNLRCPALRQAERGGPALRLRCPCARWRGPAPPAAVHAQDQPRPPAGAQA